MFGEIMFGDAPFGSGASSGAVIWIPTEPVDLIWTATEPGAQTWTPTEPNSTTWTAE